MNPLQVAQNRSTRLLAEVRKQSVVYSTKTGDKPNTSFVETRTVFAEWGPFCQPCGRATDHVGEHPGLVEAGMAVYEQDGSVSKTKLYNREQALVIAQEEYERYCANLGLA